MNKKKADDLSRRDLARYALFGLPLGFIGLPLYVHLPKYYADYLPLSLATIGTVMFLSRLLDCLLDPFIGYYSDAFIGNRRKLMYIGSLFLGLGVLGLFGLPSMNESQSILFWLSLLLCLTYFSYSILMINYYALGLQLTRDYYQNTRISGWRESFVMAGVLIASSLPQLLMMHTSEKMAYRFFSYLFILLLIFATLISLSQKKFHYDAPKIAPAVWKQLFRERPLKWIFAIFFLNTIPPSLTATLFLFYVDDILKLANFSGGFLIAYFLSAILGMPAWTLLSHRIQKRRTLICSMILAMASFAWVYSLVAHQWLQFLVICILSGIALGGDLTVLPSLLADSMRKNKRRGGLEFGIWNFISKFTLALSAGITLPLLGWMGYAPQGESSFAAQRTLIFLYAILPCLFKGIALIILILSPIDKEKEALE